MRKYSCRRIVLAAAVVLMAGWIGFTQAQRYLDGVIWPEPPVVTPGGGSGPPSDAVVLFDGKDFDAWEGAKDWKTDGDGGFTVKGVLRTKQSFGDMQLHLEFATPAEVKGKGQGRGNNGVGLIGARYEIQVLDSYENKTYPEGQCAAVYNQTPPMVNASRKPGEWQTYDLVFTAPRFGEGNKVVTPAYVTLLHNGVLVQNHTEVKGSTHYDRENTYERHPDKGPLVLMYHGNPVRFRNIWVREIKPLVGKPGGPVGIEGKKPATKDKGKPPEVKTLPIGAAAPDFTLPGVDGRKHRLKDFADAKVLVVLFTCNHCPTAQAYEDRIIKLHADYKDRGVALVAISPNDPRAVRLDELGYTDLSDSLADMKIRAKDKGFTFPYLYDGETQKTSLAYGALATPHVFVFDADRRLRYNGRIDDAEVKTVKSHDARNAIDALLAGKPVKVETTRVFGCSTKWADKRADAERSVAKWDKEPVELDRIDEAGVKKLAANDTKKLRVINVWATACGPCIAELPEFVTMNRMYRRRAFEMITISLDDPKKAEQALKVLKEQRVACKNYLYTGEDRDKFGDALDAKWPGPLPHTVVIAPGGKIIYRKTGQIDPLEVKKVIANQLGRTY